MDFPQYRKLSNDKVYYKIIDEMNFDEIQIVGSRIMKYSTNATQYPEILRIKDMISDSATYLSCSEEEYQAILEL